MTQGDLHELLQSLKKELETMDGDPVSRDRIKSLANDIEQFIEQGEGEIDQQSLTDRMRSVVDQFEMEHPAATSVLGRLMTALRDMGI